MAMRWSSVSVRLIVHDDQARVSHAYRRCHGKGRHTIGLQFTAQAGVVGKAARCLSPRTSTSPGRQRLDPGYGQKLYLVTHEGDTRPGQRRGGRPGAGDLDQWSGQGDCRWPRLQQPAHHETTVVPGPWGAGRESRTHRYGPGGGAHLRDIRVSPDGWRGPPVRLAD